MGYPVLLMTLGSSMVQYYYDSHLILDTMMSSMKSTAVQLPQYGSGHSEFKPMPASKAQSLGIGDNSLPANDVGRRPAGN